MYRRLIIEPKTKDGKLIPEKGVWLYKPDYHTGTVVSVFLPANCTTTVNSTGVITIRGPIYNGVIVSQYYLDAETAYRDLLDNLCKQRNNLNHKINLAQGICTKLNKEKLHGR